MRKLLCVALLTLACSIASAQTEIVGSRQAQGGFNNLGASSAGTDTYAVSPTRAIRAYVDGACFTFEADVENTLAATLNISALGAISILRSDGSALATGDIAAGEIVYVCYDATGPKFQMVGGGGAPSTSTYLLLGTCPDAGLSAERCLAAGTGISIADGGAGGNATVSVDATSVATLGGNNAYTGSNRHAPSATQSLTGVGNTITCNANNVQIDSDGDYTLTSTPTIADGSSGQWCRITNVDAAQTVTLTHGAANNLDLGGSNYALAPNQAVTLWWNADLSDWVIQQVSTTAKTKVQQTKDWWFVVRNNNLSSHITHTSADISAAGAATPTAANDRAYYFALGNAETIGIIVDLQLPSQWDSASATTFDLWTIEGTTFSGDQSADVQTKCLADGERFNGSGEVTFNTAQQATATMSGTAGNVQKSTIATLTMTGCAAGEWMRIRVGRNASDTSSDNMQMLHAQLSYYVTLE